MRMIVVKTPTTAEDLRARLGRVEASQTLDDIAKLNPHVDLKAIEPGTVLLVPEPAATTPGRTDESEPVQEQPFEELRDQLVGAMSQTTARVAAGYDTLAAQAKEITPVLKSAAVKKAMELDPEFKAQVEAAAGVFKQDTANAKAAETALKQLQKQVTEDLGALQKLLA